MVEPVALLALTIDGALGWPQPIYRRIGHPVGWFAAVITACEGRWNRVSQGAAFRRAAGIATVAILLSIAIIMGTALQALLVAIAGTGSWLLVALFAAPGLAARSLHSHVRAVAAAIEGGDLASARVAVGMIVGRDTADLDEAGVCRAAIESLAESFCDGVAAPFLWLLVFGLPGIWAYKAINTADSLIGHREARWRAFGWAAARTDDALNLLPARIAAILICLCGGGGWRTMWRDAGRHASPNAGWPEAAMAGALGLSLAGPIAYDGVAHAKPWIGSGRREAAAPDISRALAIHARACLCLAIIAGALAWAL